MTRNVKSGRFWGPWCHRCNTLEASGKILGLFEVLVIPFISDKSAFFGVAF